MAEKETIAVRIQRLQERRDAIDKETLNFDLGVWDGLDPDEMTSEQWAAWDAGLNKFRHARNAITRQIHALGAEFPPPTFLGMTLKPLRVHDGWERFELNDTSIEVQCAGNLDCEGPVDFVTSVYWNSGLEWVHRQMARIHLRTTSGGNNGSLPFAGEPRTPEFSKGLCPRKPHAGLRL